MELCSEIPEEPDYELDEEQRKKALREYKEKIKQPKKGICPKCNNPFELGSEYCSSCGIELRK